MPYKVLVDDNFHYMDEDETYTYGEFETLSEAVNAAKRIVDSSLSEQYKPGMNADELYDLYKNFGEDPYIAPGFHHDIFSAWDYAKERCYEICNQE